MMKVKVIVTDDDGVVYDGTLNLKKTIKNPQIHIHNDLTQPQNNEILINIPKNLIKPILKFDERKQIPILWSFSTQEVMTINQFVDACSKKGFLLSARWLLSVGSHFRTKLIKEDQMLTEAQLKINGKKTWQLTTEGKTKIKKELSRIKQNMN